MHLYKFREYYCYLNCIANHHLEPIMSKCILEIKLTAFMIYIIEESPYLHSFF